MDACVGNAIETGTFSKEDTVCTKTLYNYVDLGLLPIKNIDLPEKPRRNTKAKRIKENKRKLGKSIEERPEYIQNRQEFGHWEIDSVIGVKDESEPAIMTVVERMTRMALWIKIKDHTADSVNEALIKIFENFKVKNHKSSKLLQVTMARSLPDSQKLRVRDCSIFYTPNQLAIDDFIQTRILKYENF